METYKL